MTGAERIRIVKKFYTIVLRADSTASEDERLAAVHDFMRCFSLTRNQYRLTSTPIYDKGCYLWDVYIHPQRARPFFDKIFVKMYTRHLPEDQIKFLATVAYNCELAMKSPVRKERMATDRIVKAKQQKLLYWIEEHARSHMVEKAELHPIEGRTNYWSWLKFRDSRAAIKFQEFIYTHASTTYETVLVKHTYEGGAALRVRVKNAVLGGDYK